jgi:hypothetical protein
MVYDFVLVFVFYAGDVATFNKHVVCKQTEGKIGHQSIGIIIAN